jgi:hypothetical protein
MPLDRAPSDAPQQGRADHQHGQAGHAAREVGAHQQAERDHDQRLDHRDDRQLDQPPADQGRALDRGDQEPVDHAPIEPASWRRPVGPLGILGASLAGLLTGSPAPAPQKAGSAMPIDPTDLAKSIGALGSLDPERAWPAPCSR